MEWRTKAVSPEGFDRLKNGFARFLLANGSPAMKMAAKPCEAGFTVAIGGERANLDYIEAKHSPGGWVSCGEPDDWTLVAHGTIPKE